MVGMGLMLGLLAQGVSAEGFRAQLLVEEGGTKASYVVDFEPGMIRIEPRDTDVYLILDVSAPNLTLVNPEQKYFVCIDSVTLPLLVEAELVRRNWFPWVSSVSPDLIEGVSLEERGSAALPDGKRGLYYVGDSPEYDRPVAEYRLDPKASPELFFQWTEVYEDFWGEPAPEAEAAQKKRLALYGSLPRLPLVSEERFVFLSRPRIIRIEERQKIPEDAFTIPEDYEEKSAADLLRETLTEPFAPALRYKGKRFSLLRRLAALSILLP